MRWPGSPASPSRCSPCSLFASYLCYLKKRAEPQRATAYLVASLVFYALACLSKETAVILPFVIFACEIVWNERVMPAWWRTWLARGLDAGKVVAPYLALLRCLHGSKDFCLARGFRTPRSHTPISACS